MRKQTKRGSNRVTKSPSDEELSDQVTQVHTGVDLAIKGADYTVSNIRKVMENTEVIAEARRAEDERVRRLAYNDGWARGFLYGLSVGIGIFTLAALFTLWSIMP